MQSEKGPRTSVRTEFILPTQKAIDAIIVLIQWVATSERTSKSIPGNWETTNPHFSMRQLGFEIAQHYDKIWDNERHTFVSKLN